MGWCGRTRDCTLGSRSSCADFGAELFYRGFIQGELNRAFGRPWKIAGVPFGPGLIIATLTFAAGHGVPFLGAPEWDPWAMLQTGIFAFFAGLLRERTGGIFAPAMLHATIDLNWHLFRLHRVLRICQFVCTGVAIFFILRWIADDRSDPPEQLQRGDA
jgi:membrane protease YdiL (CAAX protease family)